MHDVTLTYFMAPDCTACETFSPLVTEVAHRRGLALAFVNVREDPDRTAVAGVRIVPTLVAKVDGIPVARLDGSVPVEVVEAFLDSAELAEAI